MVWDGNRTPIQTYFICKSEQLIPSILVTQEEGVGAIIRIMFK